MEDESSGPSEKAHFKDFQLQLSLHLANNVLPQSSDEVRAEWYLLKAYYVPHVLLNILHVLFHLIHIYLLDGASFQFIERETCAGRCHTPTDVTVNGWPSLKPKPCILD